jgi:NDP-sugar pyrophosphorylase family protein
MQSGAGRQANDFGSEVIPGAKDMGMHIQAYLYDGYWEDIGTIEAFYDANLALTDNPSPKFRSVKGITPPVSNVLGRVTYTITAAECTRQDMGWLAHSRACVYPDISLPVSLPVYLCTMQLL